jgi:hypothetical protein
MDLPLYRSMDRRAIRRVKNINAGIRNKYTISNKGEGYTYIVRNTEMKEWFKIGFTKTEKSFRDRIQSYKSIFPIGEWEVLHLSKVDDVALEEFRLKNYYRYCLKYEMGINSKEWFKGDSEKVKIEYNINPKPKTKKVKRRIKIKTIIKECKIARYSYKEAREFINNL